MRPELPSSLQSIADRQSGMVSSTQLFDDGATEGFLRAQLAGGRWQRVHPGVYATFNGSLSRTAEIWAALLWAGPDAAVSHQTAAELWGMVDEPASLIHVRMPARRRVRPRPGIRIHYGANSGSELIPTPAGTPAVGAADTVLDLIGECDEVERMLFWVTRECMRSITSRSALATAVGLRRRQRWRRELLDVVSNVSTDPLPSGPIRCRVEAWRPDIHCGLAGSSC